MGEYWGLEAGSCKIGWPDGAFLCSFGIQDYEYTVYLDMRRINDPHHARFLTFSTYQSLDLFGSDALRDVFCDQLKRTQELRDFQLYAWVLMPNHVHMLIRDQETGEVQGFLRSLKAAVARKILTQWRELDAQVLDRLVDHRGRTRFWQHGGGYDRNIVSEDEFNEKIGYIHMNPVRAGLVERPADWAWSSARWWSGDREDEIRYDLVLNSTICKNPKEDKNPPSGHPESG